MEHDWDGMQKALSLFYDGLRTLRDKGWTAYSLNEGILYVTSPKDPSKLMSLFEGLLRVKKVPLTVADDEEVISALALKLHLTYNQCFALENIVSNVIPPGNKREIEIRRLIEINLGGVCKKPASPSQKPQTAAA